MSAEELLRRRLERERAARAEGERILGERVQALYETVERQRYALEVLKGRAENLDEEVARRIKAEALDHDRHELLEMIARHRPLGMILDRLQAMVEAHVPPSVCAVILAPRDPERPPVLEEGSEPDLQASWGLRRLGDLQGGDHPEVLRGWARAHQVEEGWSIPILFGADPFMGLMVLGFPKAPELLDQDTEVMELFARMAGMAIHHRQLLETLAFQARYDTLTNLPNRSLFQDRLQQALHQARRTDGLVGLMFLDLDGFKHINDTLGHHVGDLLLVAVAQRLQGLLRATDTLARMGGDEFTLVLPNIKGAQGAGLVAQKCLQALQVPFQIHGHELFIGASIGISLFPQDATEADQLQRNADAAMYQTKAKGKNGFSFFTSDLNTRAQERLEVEGLLRRALENREFELQFQPQFSSDGGLVGCEALLRWVQPRLGRIPPAKFIPIAEENGMILPIGEWVLREACGLMSAWHSAGHAGLRVAVNVSSLQFQMETFVEQVAEILDSTGLEAHYLELELTETLVMENPAQTARRLKDLRALGVRIAVDDFGTGYSSLSYLQRLPLDVLKIDQSFVRDIHPAAPQVPSSAPIVQTIVALARSLGLALMAEGVETQEQRAFLEELRCEGMQGYFFARPMDPQDFLAFAAARTST